VAQKDGNRERGSEKVNHHEHESIVPVADYPSEFEANIAAATLQDAGIDARVEVLRLGAYSSSLGGVIRVVVFQNDLERARALLAEQ
jgi:hypothetical protein